MDMGIPPLEIKILLEKSRILVQRLAVNCAHRHLHVHVDIRMFILHAWSCSYSTTRIHVHQTYQQLHRAQGLWHAYACATLKSLTQWTQSTRVPSAHVVSLVFLVWISVPKSAHKCRDKHSRVSFREGEGTVDCDAVASNRSTESCLINFSKRISSNPNL